MGNFDNEIPFNAGDVVSLEDLEVVTFSNDNNFPNQIDIDGLSPQMQLELMQLLSDQQNNPFANLSPLQDSIPSANFSPQQIDLSTPQFQTQLPNSHLVLIPCFHYKQVQAITSYSNQSETANVLSRKLLSLQTGDILTVLSEDETGKWTLSWSVALEAWGWHPTNVVTIFEEDFTIFNPYINAAGAAEAMQSAMETEKLVEQLANFLPDTVNTNTYFNYNPQIPSNSFAPQTLETPLAEQFFNNQLSHTNPDFNFAFLQHSLPMLDPSVIDLLHNPAHTSPSHSDVDYTALTKPLPPLPPVDFPMEPSNTLDSLFNFQKSIEIDATEVMIPFSDSDDRVDMRDMFGDIESLITLKEGASESPSSVPPLTPSKSPSPTPKEPKPNTQAPKPTRRKRKAVEAQPGQQFPCKWTHPTLCTAIFDTAFLLYEHLKTEHIGRRHSEQGLCLQCHWDGCTMVKKKRDHITSHLVVHVPLTYSCEICQLPYKRLQDLRKHIKQAHDTEETSPPPPSSVQRRNRTSAIANLAPKPYTRNSGVPKVPSVATSDSETGDSPIPMLSPPASDSITLSIHLWNAPPSRAFTITISKTQSVHNLKEQVKLCLPKSYETLRASELDLYKIDEEISIEDSRLNQGRVQEVLNCTLMLPVRTISKYFGGDVGEDLVNIVVSCEVGISIEYGIPMAAPWRMLIKDDDNGADAVSSTVVKTESTSTEVVVTTEDIKIRKRSSSVVSKRKSASSVDTAVQSELKSESTSISELGEVVMRKQSVTFIEKQEGVRQRVKSSQTTTQATQTGETKSESAASASQTPKKDSIVKILDKGTLLIISMLNMFGFGIRKRRPDPKESSDSDGVNVDEGGEKSVSGEISGSQ
ncbi:hypothetical protein HK098_002165 [Nowakowskiella sp. JEL0407]|nr:hypothetical protein HK098_002165 [Nowakowskiella sp. JEL0407]